VSPHHPFHCWARFRDQAPLSGLKASQDGDILDINVLIPSVSHRFDGFDKNVEIRRPRDGASRHL